MAFRTIQALPLCVCVWIGAAIGKMVVSVKAVCAVMANSLDWIILLSGTYYECDW